MSFRRRMMANVGNVFPADAIMTIKTNPEVLAICYAQGWCDSSKYMTTTEAATVTSVGMAFKNKVITHFEEFKYFTGVTSIADGAFSGCSTLTNIEFPISITSVGNYAFNNCSNLQYIHVTRNVTSIGHYVFNQCNKLTNVKYDSNLPITDNRMFWQCAEYTSDVHTVIDGILYRNNNTVLHAVPPKWNKNNGELIVPPSVTTLGNSCIYSNSYIKKIVVNEGCTTAGEWVGGKCSNLTQIDLPSTFISMNYYCFRDCKKLDTIISRRSTAPSVGEYSFGSAGASSTNTKILYVPNGATGYNTGRWNSYLLNNGWTLDTIS